jgi:hypothetical protein
MNTKWALASVVLFAAISESSASGNLLDASAAGSSGPLLELVYVDFTASFKRSYYWGAAEAADKYQPGDTLTCRMMYLPILLAEHSEGPVPSHPFWARYLKATSGSYDPIPEFCLAIRRDGQVLWEPDVLSDYAYQGMWIYADSRADNRPPVTEEAFRCYLASVDRQLLDYPSWLDFVELSFHKAVDEYTETPYMPPAILDPARYGFPPSIRIGRDYYVNPSCVTGQEGYDFDLDSVDVTVIIVPEPVTLFSLALGSFVLLRKRRA